jgi:hypothetical protein
MGALAEKFLTFDTTGMDIKGVVLMVDYDGALRKVFSDWKKFVIGVLLSMFPIIRWLAKGYMFENTGLGKHKKSKVLPEWKNWQDLFIKGFAGTVISFLYVMPAVLILIVGGVVGFIGYADDYVQGSAFVALQGAGDASAVSAIKPGIVNAWPLHVLSLFTLPSAVILAFLLWIGAYYLLPAGILNFMKTGRMEDAFKFGEVTRLTMSKQYLTVWLVVSLSAALAFYAFSWIPIIGWAAAYFVIGVFGYTLFGEVFKEVG